MKLIYIGVVKWSEARNQDKNLGSVCLDNVFPVKG